MKTCVTTIVSANYLAYARTLGSSVHQHYPDAVFRVLIVDRPTEEVRAAAEASGLEIIYAQDLGLNDFDAIAFKYELVEFNTALKPTFLKRQFAEGFDRVLYLDPDIYVYEGLQPVFKALEQAQIVLTPHTIAPAMDGLRPSDIDFLRNGAYNLGFIAMSRGPETDAALDWWEDRCLSYGFNDLAFGTFVDQKWMDLLPSYYASVHVLRNQGCNVAYWNLHERPITIVNGHYFAAELPLSFFHFSGVKASNPKALSRHQTRHKLAEGTVLADMVQTYCDRLIEFGHANYVGLAYTFAHFDNGRPITQTMRRASCFLDAARKPFASVEPLYKKFDLLGWVQTNSSRLPTIQNTLNFDQDNRTVSLTNRVVRLLVRLLGADRFLAALRYAAFLTRESNYARVLCKVPFDFTHSSRRPQCINNNDVSRHLDSCP